MTSLGPQVVLPKSMEDDKLLTDFVVGPGPGHGLRAQRRPSGAIEASDVNHGSATWQQGPDHTRGFTSMVPLL